MTRRLAARRPALFLAPLAALLLPMLGAVSVRPAVAAEPGLVWSEWSKATFERARRERRLVVVEVSAAWCHWCHVMERETYADPRVRAALDEAFLPVKVDADARPDLAERYAEYHWPATVFLTPDATEIAALRGYRAPDEFLGILREVRVAAKEGRTLLDRPVPSGSGTSGASSALPPDLRARLLRLLDAGWDPIQAGWGRGQKYPYAPPVRHALLEARLTRDAEWSARALRTLGAWEALIDPVWGGMYQYSEGGVWDRPHFEKIVSVNAGAIAAYADAFRLTRDDRWRRDAYAVRRHLLGMLSSPSGAFYTSQDADVGAHGGPKFVDGHEYFPLGDAGRRRLGMPRIDTAVYAQENGWAIEALCELSDATLDPAPLEEAVAAARAILATHRDPRGGLRHAAGDEGVLHLGDQVAFGRGLWALAQSTGDAVWIEEALRVADALLARFLDTKRGGFFSLTEDPDAAGAFRERLRPWDGNAAAARFLLGLHASTEKGRLRDEALRAIVAVSDPGLAERFAGKVAPLLLAVEEATFPWTHAVVVGAEGDATAEALWRAVRAFDAPLVTRERLLPEQPSAIPGVVFPPELAPAAFLCGAGRCSSPIRDAAALPAAWKAFRR